MRQRGCLVRSDLEDELRVDRVDRVHGAVDEVRRSEGFVAEVRHGPRTGRRGQRHLRRRGKHLLDRLALLGVRREHERFERRSRLPAAATALLASGQVNLEGVVVAPADVGADRATPVEGHERSLRIVRLVQHLRDGRLCRLLVVEVQGRGDAQPAAVDRTLTELRDGFLTNEIDEPRCDSRRGLRQLIAVDGADRLLLDRRGVGLAELVVVDHRIEDVIATLSCHVLSRTRIRGLGAAEQADEKGRLVRVQLIGSRAEVHVRRGLDAIRTATEVHDVQVALENVSLVVRLLELDRQHRFLRFTGERAVAVQVAVLDQLLRDRAAALQRATTHVVPQGPDDTTRIDTTMVEEMTVLRRDQRVDDHGRDLVERHWLAKTVLLERGDLPTLRIHDDRRLQRREILRQVHRVPEPQEPDQADEEKNAEAITASAPIANDDGPSPASRTARLPPLRRGCVLDDCHGRRGSRFSARHTHRDISNRLRAGTPPPNFGSIPGAMDPGIAPTLSGGSPALVLRASSTNRLSRRSRRWRRRSEATGGSEGRGPCPRGSATPRRERLWRSPPPRSASPTGRRHHGSREWERSPSQPGVDGPRHSFRAGGLE